MKNYLALD